MNITRHLKISYTEKSCWKCQKLKDLDFCRLLNSVEKNWERKIFNSVVVFFPSPDFAHDGQS